MNPAPFSVKCPAQVACALFVIGKGATRLHYEHRLCRLSRQHRHSGWFGESCYTNDINRAMLTPNQNLRLIARRLQVEMRKVYHGRGLCRVVVDCLHRATRPGIDLNFVDRVRKRRNDKHRHARFVPV